MHKHNWPYALMVSELQRTESAIKSHLQRMGLIVWDKEKQEYVKKEAAKRVAPKKQITKPVVQKQTSTKATADMFPDSPQNRVGKHWTRAEEARLDRLYKEGNDIPVLMALMGRTESALMSRLAKLGYFEYNKETKQYDKK